MMLENECSKFYTDEMRESFSKINSYFNESELHRIHNETKERSLSKVCNCLFEIQMFTYYNRSVFCLLEQFQHKRKFGGDELIAKFRSKLVNEIENKFIYFEGIDNSNRSTFHVSLDKSYKFF